jgi:hypothetical protein
MQLTFSEQMTLKNSIPWINYTEQKNINVSWINKSNMFMSVLPSNNRDQDFGFNYSQLSFDWNVTSVNNQSIYF